MGRKRKNEEAPVEVEAEVVEEEAVEAAPQKGDLVQLDSLTVVRLGVEDPDPVVVWDDGSR